MKNKYQIERRKDRTKSNLPSVDLSYPSLVKMSVKSIICQHFKDLICKNSSFFLPIRIPNFADCKFHLNMIFKVSVILEEIFKLVSPALASLITFAVLSILIYYLLGVLQ